jgi:hypothetical protein
MRNLHTKSYKAFCVQVPPPLLPAKPLTAVGGKSRLLCVEFRTEPRLSKTDPSWSSGQTSRHALVSLIVPSFRSSILHFPLIAPHSLILNHSIIYSSFQHSFHEPGYQKALNLVSGVCHSTSSGVLSTKHSITNGFSTTIGSRWYTKGYNSF